MKNIIRLQQKQYLQLTIPYDLMLAVFDLFINDNSIQFKFDGKQFCLFKFGIKVMASMKLKSGKNKQGTGIEWTFNGVSQTSQRTTMSTHMDVRVDVHMQFHGCPY